MHPRIRRPAAFHPAMRPAAAGAAHFMTVLMDLGGWMSYLVGMHRPAFLLLLLAPLTAGAQHDHAGLRPVKADLRPIVGAYYRFTPPAPDWYYALTPVPGPPEERTTMRFRHALPDSLGLVEQVDIQERWVDRDSLRSDSSLYHWALANVAFTRPGGGTVDTVAMRHQDRYGVDLSLRLYQRSTRVVQGIPCETQVLSYVLKSPRACVLPTYANSYAVQCRMVVISYTREDRVGTAPDLATDPPLFDRLSLLGSEPY